MIQDSYQDVNGDSVKISPPPPKDDFVRIAELDMSEVDFSKRYPHVVIHGPLDDPYVSRSELEEGDRA